jgi:hypothetical protein
MARAPGKVHIVVYEGLAYGPLLIRCLDASGAAVDLTGYTAHAEIRENASGAVKLDLAPTISDATAGEITISRTDEQTDGAAAGKWKWDLVLENPSGDLIGPIVEGNASIISPITQP